MLYDFIHSQSLVILFLYFIPTSSVVNHFVFNVPASLFDHLQSLEDAVGDEVAISDFLLISTKQIF